jgi:hypothetical protein
MFNVWVKKENKLKQAFRRLSQKDHEFKAN